MRLAFFGAGGFGLEPLKAVHRSYGVELVVTLPPRPSGRGLKPTPCPIWTAARSLGLKTAEPEEPNSPGFVSGLGRSWDCFVVCDYGAILGEELLALPRLGSLGVHPSLLPSYRGAAPIQRALMAGATRTGVSIFLMEKKVDAGPILAQTPLEILPEEDYGALAERLSRVGAELLVETLNLWAEGRVRPQPQDPTQASYAPRLKPEELLIDWREDARRIRDLIRALSPRPMARTVFRGRTVAIRSAREAQLSSKEPPGTILPDGASLIVATGRGGLEVLWLKPEARRLMTGADFRNGYRPQPGERFGSLEKG